MITISAELSVDVGRAWTAWTGPEHIVNWNFASDDWHCPSAVNHVEEGGTFSWRMEAKDGSMCFDFEGTYTKVVPEQLLEYDLGDGRPVTVRFEKQEGGVRVSETFQGEDEHTLEQQRQGWQAILNNFKTYAERL